MKFVSDGNGTLNSLVNATSDTIDRTAIENAMPVSRDLYRQGACEVWMGRRGLRRVVDSEAMEGHVLDGLAADFITSKPTEDPR